MAEPVAPAATAVSVPLSKLIESKSNPRKHFDSARLAQLAQSIANVGIISPLVVRHASGGFTNGEYEIVAGARRMRAAKLAKLAELPIIVRDISDADMLEVQLSENRDRDDLHPLEEAEGFERLLKMRKYTIDHLAERVRLDPSTVARRVHLVELTASLKKLFLDGEITLGHAYLICRHSPANQERIERELLYRERMDYSQGSKPKKVRDVVDVDSLRYAIEREFLFVLAKVPWDRDDVTLVASAGSCTGCPKRSGRHLALFDDLKASDDRCLDSRCYAAKLEAHIVRVIEKAAPAKPIRVAGHWMQHVPKGVVPSDQFRKADKASCDHVETAVVVAGDNDIGRLIHVCRDKKCKHHWRSTYGSSAQKRQADLARRIQKAQVEQLHTVVDLALKTDGYRIRRRELIWVFDLLFDFADADPNLDERIAEKLGIKLKAHAVLVPEKMRPALRKLPERAFNELLLSMIASDAIARRHLEFFRDLGIDVEASEKRVADRLKAEAAAAKSKKPAQAKPAAKGKK